MRVADSQRIRANKLLGADNDRQRFARSQKLYKNALENYEESLLYDETGNPEVFHKFGFTFLLQDPPNLDAAKGMFQKGIKIYGDSWTQYRLKQDKSETKEDISGDAYEITKRIRRIAAQTKEDQYLDAILGLEDPRPKDDFALTLSGIGLVYFLDGIKNRVSVLEAEDKTFALAIKYLEAAEKFAAHKRAKAADSFLDKLRDYFDLFEIIEPTPHAILLARVYLYQARELEIRGHPKLASLRLQNAQDALERVRIYYAEEPRFLTEIARLQFLRYQVSKSREDLDLALKSLEGIKTDSASYWDARTTNLIRGNVLLELKKVKEAISVILDLRDRDPMDPEGILLQARQHALENEFEKVEDDLLVLFTDETRGDDDRLLMAAGRIYFDMGLHDKAKDYFLKASYVDPKDIQVNYYLGQAYKSLGDEKNMSICFQRVANIDVSSDYAKEILPILNN